MKQILIVANLASSFGGNFIESMKSLQEAEGISVRYLLPEQAKSCEWISDLTEVHYTDWSFSSLKKVWHELNQDAPVEIVHFHFVGGIPAIRCRLIFQCPESMVWHLHNHVGSSKGHLSWLKTVLKKWLYHGTYKIGVSRSVTESMKKFSSSHLFTIYNALDFNRLAEVGEDRYIDDAPGTIRCMIMGNHFERKGNDIAAKAIQKIISGGVPAKLYIVANEYFQNDLAVFLTKTIGNDSWQKYIKRLPPRNDIATYYRKMDIFLSPSREEGWTWAIDEAAYCGCQVIVSKIPGQDENDVPGFCWVGNPNTQDISEEISQKILSLYQLSEEQKKANLDKAQAYMTKEFSMEKWREKILDVYNQMN